MSRSFFSREFWSNQWDNGVSLPYWLPWPIFILFLVTSFNGILPFWGYPSRITADFSSGRFLFSFFILLVHFKFIISFWRALWERFNCGSFFSGDLWKVHVQMFKVLSSILQWFGVLNCRFILSQRFPSQGLILNYGEHWGQGCIILTWSHMALTDTSLFSGYQ